MNRKNDKMTERLPMLSDMMTYILGTAFLLWAYIKSLKENTFDGKTYMPGFLCSLAKYGLVALINDKSEFVRLTAQKRLNSTT